MRKYKKRTEKSQGVREKYRTLTKLLIARKLTITTMESCTSGLIASLITDTEGASAVMPGAFVTYSNQAKIRCGVPAEIIEKYGVYSSQTAAAMSEACRAFYGTAISAGITGTFGNVDPVNADSVPGTVYICADVCGRRKEICLRLESGTGRNESKLAAAEALCDMLMGMLGEDEPGAADEPCDKRMKMPKEENAQVRCQRQEVPTDSQRQEASAGSQGQDASADSQRQEVPADSQRQDASADSQRQEVPADSQRKD